MKRFISLLLFLFLLTYLASAQKQITPNFILRGTFTGKHTHAIFLQYIDGNGKRIERKAYIRRGKFLFRELIASPVYAGLISDIKVKPKDIGEVSNFTEIFLSPGEMTVSLHENDFGHAKITGSIMQSDYDQFEMQRQLILKSKDSLDFNMNKLRQKVNTAEVHKAYLILLDKLNTFDKKDNQFEYYFIKTHPSSYFSVYLLDNCFSPGGDLSLDSAEIIYNTFTPYVKNSIAGISLRKKITNCKASAVGSFIKLPIVTDVNGKVIHLHQIMNKGYVIFDFWASWCIPCNQENLHLKQLYNKYHAKGLGVVTISVGDYKKFWKDTIKKLGITKWHNTLANNVANLDTFYNIEQMAPSLFLLIDKRGKIIGRYRGNGGVGLNSEYNEGTVDDLDRKIAQIMPDN